jgi:hypothetical protein
MINLRKIQTKGKIGNKEKVISYFPYIGVPTEIRTPVYSVKGSEPTTLGNVLLRVWRFLKGI